MYIRTTGIIKFLEKEIEEIEKQRFKNLFTSGRVEQISRIVQFIKTPKSCTK